MFAAAPLVSRLPLGRHGDAEHSAVVLDGFLLEPEALVELAARHRAAFAPTSANAFPGPELPLPEALMAGWADAVALHAGPELGVGPARRAHGRLSIVTLAPADLSPMQRLCHRDRLDTREGEWPLACVVYLFDDPALGGTAFYRPRLPPAEIDAVMAAAAREGHAWLDAQIGPARGYLTQGNRWFERTAVVAPAFNRAIVYRGDLFHTSHLEHPERLSDDPRQGRLTMNGFFVCPSG